MHFGQGVGALYFYCQFCLRTLQIHSEENVYFLNWAWSICTYSYRTM